MMSKFFITGGKKPNELDDPKFIIKLFKIVFKDSRKLVVTFQYKHPILTRRGFYLCQKEHLVRLRLG